MEVRAGWGDGVRAGQGELSKVGYLSHNSSSEFGPDTPGAVVTCVPDLGNESANGGVERASPSISRSDRGCHGGGFSSRARGTEGGSGSGALDGVRGGWGPA
ncbi:hypothetical protein GCM10009733_071870 [Nonomuraea maheshkhaliensis]|uniref:Uncharacterized protein n=1 Tax=Nonomuraea maheshkhaliensis TaxID=419590 RepID=A0ABN2G2H1_9ACTN